MAVTKGVKAKVRVQCGYELTLSVCARADLGALVGLFDRALDGGDDALRAQTAGFLSRCEDAALTRLLVRRFMDLDAESRAALIARPDAVLAAAGALAAVDDSRIRASVVEALAALADRRSIPLMLRYLDDPSAPVRDRARTLLHTISRRYGSQLAESGGKEREYLRTALGLVLRGGDITDEGLHALLALGDDGFHLLLPFLREEDTEGRDKIVGFLRRDTGAPTVRCLFFLAATSMESTRKLGRDILKERTEGPFLCQVARVVAGGTDSALAPLLTTLRHMPWEALTADALACEDAGTQKAVLDLLRGFGGPTSARVEKLVPFLGSRHAEVRAEALQMLGDAPPKAIYPHLAPLFDDPIEVIALRATSLVQVNETPEAVGRLMRQLGHPSLQVREEAARKLSGRHFFLLSRRWEHLTPELRARIVPTLARIDAEFPRQLAAELESGDGMRVLRALAMARALEDIAILAPSLANLTLFPDAYVRATAAGLLGRLPGHAGGSAIELLLGDRDPRVLSNCVASLARIGDAGAVPRIVPLLAHWHHRVRATAAVALWRLGYTDVIASLRGMLAHTDGRMQRSARWAVAALRKTLADGREADGDGR